MANQSTELTGEARVQQIMEQFGVSRDAARLLLTIDSGDAFVNDRISLGPDDPLDPELEEELARWHRERIAERSA